MIIDEIVDELLWIMMNINVILCDGCDDMIHVKFVYGLIDFGKIWLGSCMKV